MSNKVSNKKRALLARKEKILKELKYYDKRIEEVQNDTKISRCYDDESSDSDMEITIDVGISVTELKIQESKLKTCLLATQELTDVQILQSEVNVLVDSPVFEREPSVSGEGLWQEVMVECRIDLVSFSMSFYTHQANHMHAPISYRNLQVTPIKVVVENELSKSVMLSLTKPSDAIEVLRSYATAHRSRRSTLAELTQKYSDKLFLEPLPQGGYLLRCGSLLQVSWTLENKYSSVAPFHHKMTFDLEYMDESYVKPIKQAHRKLGDPTVDTDERTLLLSSIIDTCLEAEKQLIPPMDSMDSDLENQIPKSSQTVDHEPENILKNSEMMGPPKCLPKKSKPKGKENAAVNKSENRKRNIDNIGECSTKKAKTEANLEDNGNVINDVARKVDDNAKNKDKAINAKEKSKSNKISPKNLQINMELKDIEYSKEKNLSEVEDNTNARAKVSNKKESNAKSDQASSTNIFAHSKNNNVESVIKTNVNNVSNKTSNTNQNKEKKNLPKTSSVESKAPKINDKVNDEYIMNINFEKQCKNKPAKLVRNSVTNNNTKITNDLAVDKIQDSTLVNSKTLNLKDPKTHSNNVNKKLKNVNKQIIRQNSKSLNKDLKNIRNKKHDDENEAKMKNAQQYDLVEENETENKTATTKISKNIEKIRKDVNKNKKMLTANVKQKSDERIVSLKEQQNTNSINKANDTRTTYNTKTVKNRKGAAEHINSNIKQNIVDNTNNFISSPTVCVSSKKEKQNEILISSENNTQISGISEISKDMTKMSEMKKNKDVPKNDVNDENNKINTKDKNFDKNAQINSIINNPNKHNFNENRSNSANYNKKTLKKNLNENMFNKMKKSTGAINKKLTTNSIKSLIKGDKQKSQKRLSITGGIKKNPLRISPRKHQNTLSSTQDSSKSSFKSLQKQSNIPRLLKKPIFKPKI